MLIKKHKWAFDIDGVVCNTFPYFKLEFERRFKICSFEMPFYPYKLYSNIPKKDFMKIFYDGVFSDIFKPIPLSVETITEYYDKGNQIIFVTNRINLKTHTEIWLNRHFDFDYTLYAGGFNKLKLCKDLSIEGIIDDKTSTCREFHNAGLNHILHKQGHQYFEDTEGLNIMTWKEIREAIL